MLVGLDRTWREHLVKRSAIAPGRTITEHPRDAVEPKGSSVRGRPLGVVQRSCQQLNPKRRRGVLTGWPAWAPACDGHGLY